MVETFQAKYVSLHVRVSNVAARHLYEKTLGFTAEKPEAKYYADGEDAICMRLDLDTIRNQINQAAEDDDVKNGTNGTEAEDEGEPVGEVGRDPNANAKASTTDKDKDGRKIKVAVGRHLGVGELVEKVESK